jgi:hypothetical protein
MLCINFKKAKGKWQNVSEEVGERKMRCERDGRQERDRDAEQEIERVKSENARAGVRIRKRIRHSYVRAEGGTVNAAS